MSTLDARKNFAAADVLTGYGVGDTAISLAAGTGSRFPAVISEGEFNLVWWNYSDYKNPSEDPDVEIVRCVARSGDALTVTRAQEGTAASAKNVAGKTYRVMLAPTAKMISDIEAELDGKSDEGHGHVAADISDFDDAVEANAVVAGAVADIAAHEARTDNPHGVTKAQVGLGNVTNDAQIPASQKGAAGGVAELDGSGKVPSAQMPPLALTDVFVVASQAAQLALSAEEGDVAIRVDLNKSYIHNGGTAGSMADWSELLTPTDAVISVNGQTGAVSLTTSNVSEGSNLYHTTARARSAISATSPISYNATTGVISFDLSVANTFTAAQTVLRTALGATTADGWVLDNTTAATSGTQQVSPAFRFRGRGWKTSGTAASQPVDMRLFLLPVLGVNNPSGVLKLQSAINGGSYSDIWTVDTAGQAVITVLSGASATTALEISFSTSNNTPGTTRHIKFSNGGSKTFLDFYLAGQLYGAIGVDNSAVHVYVRGSNGLALYYGSNLVTPSQFAYLTPSGLYYYAGAFFQGSVAAGSTSQPSSTLTSYGSVGYKIEYVTTSRVLTGAETDILANGDEAEVCAGTPSNACSTHATQEACETRNGHGGCLWTGGDCSAFNGDVSTCGATSGCTVQTASCVGPTDSMTCTDQNNAYGGSCAYNPVYTDCSGLDEMTCSGTSGCSPSTASCSAFQDTSSGGCNGSQPGSCSPTANGCSAYNSDEGSCNANGCYYDSGSGNCLEVCSGTYFTGCTGSYESGYECQGSYNTGGCTGSYGSCTGTPTCSGVGTGSCTSEAGCSLDTGVSLTTPSGTSSIEPRFYRIKNVGATSDVTILPNTGQTIEMTTSLVLGPGEAATIAFKYRSESCGNLGSEGACNAQATCGGWVASTCGDYFDESSCVNAGCEWDGSSCSGDNSYCSGGSYVVSSNWYIMASHLL